MNIVFRGITGLLGSQKGVMSMMMLGATVGLALTNHLTPAVAACMGIAHAVFCVSHTQTNIAAIRAPGAAITAEVTRLSDEASAMGITP